MPLISAVSMVRERLYAPLYGDMAAATTWAANVTPLRAEVNTTIPWSAGSGTMAGGVALADGKVQVYCDASGNVTNLVAKPAGGETLTLTAQGEELSGTIKDGVITFNLDGDTLELTKG